MEDNQRELFKALANRLFDYHNNVEITREMIEEAKRQGVLGLINPCEYGLICCNVNVIYAHGQLYNILEGIPYVILKGFASAYYYPEPYLRSMGDVDFLIRPEDMDKVDERLREKGFAFDHETSLHKCYIKNGVMYEAHKTVNGIPQTFKNKDKFINTIFLTSRVVNGNMVIPDDYHEGLVCLFHIVEHLITTGIGVRHLCDWACFLNRNKNLDVLLKNDLIECGLWKFTRLLSLVCVKYLKVEYCQWMENAENELLEQLMDEFLLCGNFGKERRPEDEWLIVYKGSKSQGRQFFSSLANATKLHWPISDKFRFLVPIGCVFFGFRYLINIIKGRHELVDFYQLSQKARKRNKMYKELGLFK